MTKKTLKTVHKNAFNVLHHSTFNTRTHTSPLMDPLTLLILLNTYAIVSLSLPIMLPFFNK